MNPEIILASTSVYRVELLKKLQISFIQLAPVCDETPLAGEKAEALVSRLAVKKAESVASRHPNAIVIGSDQVADLQGTILGKPGNRQSAITQLRALSGKELVFYTGLAVMRAGTRQFGSCVVPTTVAFKILTDEKIERYLLADEPYNCAGSFKSESLGSTLVTRMCSDDPAALIGLPLIQLSILLEEHGVTIP